MSKESSHHVVPYKTYIIILIALLALTFGSIGITEIDLGAYTVAGALLFAVVKSFLVLSNFMHLKYDKPYIRAMVIFVFAVFIVTIIITFLDYLYR